MTTFDTLIDRIFDQRYVIKRKLGSGGMADVYLAEDQELGRSVALKLLDDRHASDEQFVERFRREAQSAAGLNHPNIVSIFDRGHAEGTYYIAMEYLDGRTLKELLVKNGPTPIPIAIDYARQILGALAFAHRNGIVHRDIKPHNIVVGGDGRLKVTDFGIARSGASQMTEVGSIVGTAQYLSPEQARGAPVDPRSDLYSLGVVLYEMLTGAVPFTGDTPVEIAMKHLSQVPKPPSELRPDIPHDLDAVVTRALAKDPDQRYGSAEEMDADLARVARGVSVSRETEDAMTQVLAGAGIAAAPTMITRARGVAPPAPPAYRAPGTTYYEEPPRGRSVWPWLIALGLIIAGGIGGWFLYTKIQDQLELEQADRRARRDAARSGRSPSRRSARRGSSRWSSPPPTTRSPKGQVSEENPAGGSKVGKGSTVTLDRLDRACRRCRCRAWSARTSTRRWPRWRRSASIRRSCASTRPRRPTRSRRSSRMRATASPRGRSVRINVSRGAKPVQVPDVTGEPFANAKSALEGQGFTVSRVDIQSDQAQGVVVASDPPAGSSVAKGSKVTLSVSKGPAATQIPDVTGQSQADATSLLEGAGLNVAVIIDPVTDPSQDGIVLSTNPPAGADAKQGEIVTIHVGQLSGGPGGDGTTTTTTTP